MSVGNNYFLGNRALGLLYWSNSIRFIRPVQTVFVERPTFVVNRVQVESIVNK